MKEQGDGTVYSDISDTMNVLAYDSEVPDNLWTETILLLETWRPSDEEVTLCPGMCARGMKRLCVIRRGP